MRFILAKRLVYIITIMAILSALLFAFRSTLF
jgi:hypothetical protein